MEVFIMHRITLINGDGIGPEISQSVMDIIKASGLEINWDIQTAGSDVIEKEGTPLPQRVLNSISKQSCSKSTCYNSDWQRFPLSKCAT
jgi:isocitrate/isopropylmalate dehydrogenase